MALTYNQLTAITQKKYLPILVDNVLGSNALVARWRKGEVYEETTFGEQLIVPLAYATTTASGWYTGSATLDTTDNAQMTAASFDIKQHYANITITRTDELKNAGDEAIVSLVKAKVQLAEATMADSLGTGIYNAGTTTDAIIGLRAMVDNSDTYGGITTTDASWWKAIEDSSTTSLTIPVLQGLIGDVTVGSDKPSVISLTQDLYDDIFGLLQPQQRFQDSETANAGFTNLLFAGIPMIVDSHNPTSHLFVLNEKYIMFKVHKDENFRFQPFERPYNQNTAYAKIYLACILACNNRRMNGKFSALV